MFTQKVIKQTTHGIKRYYGNLRLRLIVYLMVFYHSYASPIVADQIAHSASQTLVFQSNYFDIFSENSIKRLAGTHLLRLSRDNLSRIRC